MTQHEAIVRYLDSQKNWITSLSGRLQISVVKKFINRDVLDIGCGRGVLEAAFTPRARRLASCDIIDQNLYDLAIDKCPAENLIYEDESFDVALMLGVIEHIENPQKAINEAKRVLRYGGRLVLSIPNGWLWKIIGLFNLPEHLKQHAAFSYRDLRTLMDNWKLLSRRPIIPGLFWLYVYEVKQ